MEFSGVTKSFTNNNNTDDDRKVEQALELLDEYWFFDNLFQSRPACMFMSTTDLWNSIQKMNIENQQQDAKKSSSTPTSISREDEFVHHQNLLRTPSLPPSIGRERTVQEKEVNPRSSKLSRGASLNSSKIVPQLSSSEVLYYNQQYSDSLYHSSNNIEEMVLGNKGASGSSTPINSSKESSPVRHSMLKTSKLTWQASLSSSKIMPWVRCSEALYYSQHSTDPIYHSSNSIREMGASGPSTPVNSSSKESSPVRHNLLRTPSLPAPREEKEILRKSSNLTRQATLNSSGVSPPIHIPKVELQPTTRISPAIPRHRTKKEPKIESLMKDTKNPPWEVIRRSLSYKKSSSSKMDLEVEEVQGFKDLGFVFDKEEINKSLANIIPGLQEKKQVDHEDADNEDEKSKTRRPYLSEAWLVQPTKPAVPTWVERRSSGEMKEQLKFWARAVASNVRQEC